MRLFMNFFKKIVIFGLFLGAFVPAFGMWPYFAKATKGKIFNKKALCATAATASAGAESVQYKAIPYLSAHISIPAIKFISLQEAFNEIQHELDCDGIQVETIVKEKYHLTLVSLNIYLNPALTLKQKNRVKAAIAIALDKASKEELRQVVNQKNVISLPFNGIRVFKKHVVSLFDTNLELDTLIQNIQRRFAHSEKIEKFIQDGSIQKIQPQQVVTEPHVSLARIQGNHQSFGKNITPNFAVPNFIISKNELNISVQEREYHSEAVY
jgi:2'-5' RNA ligase